MSAATPISESGSSRDANGETMYESLKGDKEARPETTLFITPPIGDGEADYVD